MRAFLYDIKQNKFSQLEGDQIFHCALGSDAPDSICEPLEKTDAFIWIDMSTPTAADLERVGRRFRLDPLLLEDLKGHEGRPKLHDYEDYLYLVFHALHLEHNEVGRYELHKMEIDCILGPDYLITIHARPVRALDEVAVRWRRRPEWMRNGPGFLLYELMDAVLDAYFPILDKLDDEIDIFEERLYQSTRNEKDSEPLSGDIFTLKRALLQIRHIAGPTRDVVNILLRRDAEAGGRHFAAFQDLYDHASRIVENIDTYRDILSGALDAYLAIESNRMNAIMKRLTSYSIILLLPSLLAGIFGMNFDDLPKHHGFYQSVFAMGSIVVALFLYFRNKGWT